MNLRSLLAPVGLGIVLLVVWEGYVRLAGVDAMLLPAPSAVGAFARENAGLLLSNLGTTLGTLGLGFAFGVLLGFALGILMESVRFVREATYPWLVASQMIPIPAIAPVLVLWFGFTLAPPVIVVALVCFFPVAVGTLHGLGAVPRETLQMLRTFGAGPGRLLWTAKLPGALPRIFAGVRVALALSVVGVVFGEWVGSSRGMGYLIVQFSNRLETAGLFAAIVVLAVCGMGLFGMVALVERWCLRWRTAVEERES